MCRVRSRAQKPIMFAAVLFGSIDISLVASYGLGGGGSDCPRSERHKQKKKKKNQDSRKSMAAQGSSRETYICS